MNKGLKFAFDINTLLTGMAFILFIVSPDLLSNGVGIVAGPKEHFLGYMLGASELGLATMTLLGRNLVDKQAIRVVAAGVIVFHIASACVLMQAFFAEQSTNPIGLWANVLIPRFGIAGACVYFAFYRNPLATHKKRRK